MRKATYSSALISILLFTANIIGHVPNRAEVESDVDVLKGNASKKIPFENDFGLIFLSISLNDSKPLPFILDTGFDTNIIDASLAKELGIKLTDPKMIPQPGGSIEMGKANGLKFNLKGVSLSDQDAMTAPLVGLEPIIGRRFAGILGHDFISQFVLEIDYDKRVINLFDPSGYKYDGNGEVIPVTVIEKEPFISAFIIQPGREPIAGQFKIDTGSVDAIGLNKNYFEDNSILAEGQKKLARPGVGGGGETSGYVFRIEGFKIGGFLMKDLTIGVTTESGGFENRNDAGTFGAEILSRFKVIIDYPNDRMILEKRESVFKKPFQSDMSGLQIVSTADFKSIVVKTVMSDTPASEAGLMAEDVILEIDGRNAGKIGLYRCWRMFREKEGKSLKLKIRRDEKVITKVLILKRII